MKVALLLLSSLIVILDFIEFLTSPLGLIAGISLTFHYYWSF